MRQISTTPKTTPPKFESPVIQKTMSPPSSENNKKQILIGGIIVVVLFIAMLSYFIFFDSSTEIVVPEKPIEEVIEDSQQRFEEETPAVTDSEAVMETASADSLNLNIRARDTSWVKIIYDDKKVEEFTLFPNSQKTIKLPKIIKLFSEDRAWLL